MSKPNMKREPDSREIAKFRKACRALAELSAAGWHLYLDGGGTMNLMSGPSHDENYRPRQDRILESADCGAGGGDW